MIFFNLINRLNQMRIKLRSLVKNNKLLLVPYPALSSLLQNDQHFPKFVWGLDKGDFLFSKILELFCQKGNLRVV